MPFRKTGKRVKNKLRGKGGFSLPELLLTMLILLLVTELAADGIPNVIRLYRRTTDIANAEAYLSTTMIALRSRLSLASKPEIKNNTELTFNDAEFGECKINLKDDTKEIQIYLLSNPRPLAPDGGKDLIASYETIEYGGAFFTITELKVMKNGETLATLGNDPYVIHTANP